MRFFVSILVLGFSQILWARESIQVNNDTDNNYEIKESLAEKFEQGVSLNLSFLTGTYLEGEQDIILDSDNFDDRLTQINVELALRFHINTYFILHLFGNAGITEYGITFTENDGGNVSLYEYSKTIYDHIRAGFAGEFLLAKFEPFSLMTLGFYTGLFYSELELHDQYDAGKATGFGLIFGPTFRITFHNPFQIDLGLLFSNEFLQTPKPSEPFNGNTILFKVGVGYQFLD